MSSKEKHEDLTEKDKNDEDSDDFINELRSFEFWQSVIGECVGTYFLLFISSCVGSREINSLLEKSLPIGMILMCLTSVFIPVSGSHLNPAITFTMLCLRKVSPVRTLIYVFAQCGGAISGCGTAFWVHGSRIKLIPPSVYDLYPEFIFTFLLSIIYFHSMQQSHFNAAIIIGIGYAALLSTLDCWLNPLQALGPAFLSNQFSNHWVLWLGSHLGFLCGGMCYHFIFLTRLDSRPDPTDRPTSRSRDPEPYIIHRKRRRKDEPRAAAVKSRKSGKPSTKPSQQHADKESGIEQSYFNEGRGYNTRPKHSRELPTTDICFYNLQEEDTVLTDDEQILHRKPVEEAREQFSGSSSGYHSTPRERGENFDTEDEDFKPGNQKVQRVKRVPEITIYKQSRAMRNSSSKRRIAPTNNSFSIAY